MAGSEHHQPTGNRSRTNSIPNDDALSDISTSDALRRGHGKEAYETYKRLQSDYDELLTKYAQAENTIDQLRIGAKLNLYSDLPPPQKSSFVTVTTAKQPQVLNFPRPNQACISGPLGSSVVTEHSNGTSVLPSTLSRTHESTQMESDSLTPQVRAEGIKTSLMFKLPTLQENVEDLQGHVTDGQWGHSELRELKDVCHQLCMQHEEMKNELMQAKRLERDDSDTNIPSFDDFLHEDDLEGQLYRLGLRLDEINEQIDQNLLHFPSNDRAGDTAARNSKSSLPKQPANKQHLDPELNDLMKRLRDVKESAKNDDALSRSANSLADVDDLQYSAANGVQRADKHDDFNLGHLNGDSDVEHDKKRESPNGGIDLQESGYFASETMSVSDPISSHYLSNSHNGIPLGEGGHDTSFDQQSIRSLAKRERPLSDTSVESSPNPRRSRRTSHRSRSSTVETLPINPMTYYPQYPASSPEQRSPPQASSSVLTEQIRHQPQADRKESRSRGLTNDSRHSKDESEKDVRSAKHLGSQANILRTEHDKPGYSRDTRSPDYSRDRTQSIDNTPRSRSNGPESLEPSPRQDKPGSERKPGRHRTSLSSADSRVSTPLFHPGARPKDGRTARDKTRPPTAETERGFDSGFFGSEGSRGSRFARTPEVPPQDKIRHPAVRQPIITESEGERYNPQVTHTPVKTTKRDSRRRRSYLQSLSESDEDRSLEPSASVVRPSSNHRERRAHRHTPTFPATRSDNERSRRLDGSLRRPSSSPNIYDQSERTDPLRGSRSQLRPDSLRKSLVDLDKSSRLGPRSDHDTRPMDKQSMRSYPGMDRESVRSGRRSRRGDDDSTSGYSDGGRKHRRDRVDKLQEELQRLRTQLQDEASARNLQAEMYGDLRRKHDDLEREISRRNAEHQMKTMYEDLQKKYDDLKKSYEQPQETGTQVDMSDGLRKRLEDLSMQVNDLRKQGLGDNNSGQVQFLCPFCGGCAGHHHGSYYYPGFSGTGHAAQTTGTPRHHSMGTQTQYGDDRVPPQTPRYPSTPQATSTPYYNGYHSAPVNHFHTNTYPGGVPTGSPVHHIHHLPDGRSRDRFDDEYSSDEDDRYRSRRRASSSRATRRRTRDYYPEEELDSHRLHLSLDEANRAARRMQRLSKKMLNSVASDLIRSGHR